MATSTMRRAYGVKILNSNHKDVRRLKREGYVAEIHGNKFWNTTFIAMNYLKKHPLETGSRVLDLGCGWGLLGIYCADNFDAEVTGVDADENVLPYLQLHAELNGVEMEGEKRSFEQLTVKELKNYDVLVGVEICFWDELTDMLFNLINRALKAGVKKIIIADPCRPPFNELTKRCQKKWGEKVEVVEMFLSRPVTASGDILVITND